MSGIGKQPVPLPEGVQAAVSGDVLAVEGPKGKLEVRLHPAVEVTVDEAARELRCALRDAADAGAREVRFRRALWGTLRRLAANAVEGVTRGYTKQLKVVGVGYNARLEGQALVLRCGFANELTVPVPEGVTVDAPEAGNLMVSGIGQVPCVTLTFHSVDKQLLGQFAASVRRLRPPEPYKGKGIRYADEEVKRKAGKALAAGTAT